MPNDAASTRRFFAELRGREFSRLDRRGMAYLDYTGSGLYPESLPARHAALLAERVLGNPHSQHAPSLASSAVLEEARAAMLRFVDADPAAYTVIFTPNATGAIRHVGESFPFAVDSAYVLTADNHNSVNGIREFARRAGASVLVLPLDDGMRLDDPEHQLDAAAARAGWGPRLFAYPAQSNFSGVKHPLALVERAHALGFDVLLDAAAFVPTSPLSLRQVPADFVPMSLYKIFGYPTGLGALVARREALARFRRPWFAGGTVDFVSVQNELHRFRRGPEAFEDGTPDFLGIAGVAPGVEFMESLGMERLGAHVHDMVGELLAAMTALRHANGSPLVRVYGPASTEARGGTVAFNVLAADGRPVHFGEVETRAREAGVAVRGGCFCNPGAGERALGWDAAAAARCYHAVEDAFTLDRFGDCMGAGVAVGAARASVGMATNPDDIRRLIAVLATFAAGAR